MNNTNYSKFMKKIQENIYKNRKNAQNTGD